jgi:photosystem II stability/assembly factor-like uncharacterized protein/sugar lactone lactonase YvrE
MFLSSASRSLVLIPLVLILAISSSMAEDIQAIDIAFVDELHGWVAARGTTPAIFHTDDGGKTWVRTPDPAKNGSCCIRFFDQNTGIALAFISDKITAIFRTEDAGQTWKKINTLDLQVGEYVLDLTLTSRDEGFLVGEGSGHGFVKQILEGGRVLKVREDIPVDAQKESMPYRVFGDGTGHVWMAGKNLILHSADGGKTWENQIANADSTMEIAGPGVALPGGHAWIAAAHWAIFGTRDYGKNWERQLNTDDEGNINFESISFLNPRQGCALGNSSFIFCTDDGGANWSRKKVFPTFPRGSTFLSKLFLFGSSYGWAINNGGLYKTDNGGQSFHEVLTSSEPPEADIPGESQAVKTSVNGPTELAYDTSGFLYIVEREQERVLRLNLQHGSIKVLATTSDDEVSDHSEVPWSIATDSLGSLYIADFDGRLRKLDTQSGKLDILLPAPTKGSNEPLEYPSQITVDGRGKLLVAASNKLLRLSADASSLETVAGTDAIGFAGDGGPAANASLHSPLGVAVDRDGDIFIADYENCRIRKIDNKTHVIKTIAGTGDCRSIGDGGPAVKASLDYPDSMAVDRKGNLYFVEGGAARVRRIDAAGVISTYAGTGQAGFNGDGGPATQAMLSNPSGLALDSDGNLYISDFVNNRVRRVDVKTQVISTVAGNGKPERLDVEM